MKRIQNRYNRLFKPLQDSTLQTYLGTECHQLGLLAWIVEQTGPADVLVTTFSTSDDFLCGFIRLRERGLVLHSTLLADFKASRKTLTLGTLMKNSFDEIFFGENHSKLMLISGGGMTVTVITSQNQTYGGRNESTLITTLPDVYEGFKVKLEDIITNKSTPFKEWIHLK